MKKNIAFLILLLPLTSFAASGQTVASIANSMMGQLPGVETLMVSMSYIFGIVLGIKGILKLKEHNESKGQVKLGVPIAMIVASALFLALPSTLKTGKDTLGLKGGTRSGGSSSGGSSGGSSY